MKYYIIAGEASGDLHGAGLVRALRNKDPEASIRCWGGDLMQNAGAKLVKHYRTLAFMGFTEVVMNLHIIIRNLRFCKKDVLAFKPDVLILIDYPGFNMRVAAFAAKNNLRVFYYISPQIWAWKQSRVWEIKKHVSRMFVILPFEKAFYKKFKIDVSYHGHPLMDVIGNFKKEESFLKPNSLNNEQQIIALLPGSRKQEIRRMLPVMLDACKEMADCQVVVAGAPSIDDEFYHQIAGNRSFRLIKNNTYQLLAHASVAAVTSGTATLETALFGVPMVVCYSGGSISYYLARQLIKVKFISLVNLILNRKAVNELIQHNMNANSLHSELTELLINSKKRNEMLEQFKELRSLCGEKNVAERIAEEMFERITD